MSILVLVVELVFVGALIWCINEYLISKLP